MAGNVVVALCCATEDVAVAGAAGVVCKVFVIAAAVSVVAVVVRCRVFGVAIEGVANSVVCAVVVAEVAPALVVAVVIAVRERKRVVVAVVTRVAGILRLRLVRFWGYIVLLYLRGVFSFWCAVTVKLILKRQGDAMAGDRGRGGVSL